MITSRKNKKIRCYVVDEDGKIIVDGAEVIRELSIDPCCEMSTHVLITCYKNIDDALIGENLEKRIYPIKSVFFFESDT